jgi:hypothetical protein
VCVPGGPKILLVVAGFPWVKVVLGDTGCWSPSLRQRGCRHNKGMGSGGKLRALRGAGGGTPSGSSMGVAGVPGRQESLRDSAAATPPLRVLALRSLTLASSLDPPGGWAAGNTSLVELDAASLVASGVRAFELDSPAFEPPHRRLSRLAGQEQGVGADSLKTAFAWIIRGVQARKLPTYG